MSPKITTSISLVGLAPASDRPLDILRAAFRMALEQGLRVRAQEEPGVELAIGGAWRATHHRREVNLVGAVAMALQPIPTSKEEGPDVAAARALGVTWMWVLGAVDGWACDPNAQLLTGADRDAYLVGLRAGGLLFAEMTIECPVCEKRRLPVGDDCDCTRRKRR